MVHPCLLRNLFDRIVEVLSFWTGHVWCVIEDIAASRYAFLIRDPHVVEGYPGEM